MQNIDTKAQEPGLSSRLNLNYGSVSERAISNQQNYELPEPARTEKTANLAEKEPSQIGALILVIVMIAAYIFGIHQLSQIVTNTLQTVVEEVDKDYRFRVF